MAIYSKTCLAPCSGFCRIGSQLWFHSVQSKISQRLRSPVSEAFSYGIWHIFVGHISLWFNEIWPNASLNHNDICHFPYENTSRAGLHNLCIALLYETLPDIPTVNDCLKLGAISNIILVLPNPFTFILIFYEWYLLIQNKTVGPFKSFVMNNKAFRNSFCNPQKSFHTSPTRIMDVVNHSSNSTIAFTKKKKKKKNTPRHNFFLVNAIFEFEERLTASIIRVGRFQRGVKTLLWITE